MKHLRKRMIEDMKLRALAPRTQDRYLHAIEALAEHYRRPLCRITQELVRKYLLYLIEAKGYAKSTFNVDLDDWQRPIESGFSKVGRAHRSYNV